MFAFFDKLYFSSCFCGFIEMAKVAAGIVVAVGTVIIVTFDLFKLGKLK